MSLWIYLPVAGNAVHLLLLLGMGAVVGFLSGLFGVGGGFLMTPLLIMMGIQPTIAVASDSNQIVAASASGTYAHARAGSVDFKMGALLLGGGLAGGSAGVFLIKALRGLGQADLFISATYVVMLGGIGSYMLHDSLKEIRGKVRVQVAETRPSAFARLVNSLPCKMDFPRSKVRHSVLMPLGLGVLVGVLSAIMGVGGGFIMVPVMIYLLRMPMHVVVGTSLFQILFTCANVTVLQAAVNHTVDFVLALVLLIGSVVGAQLGAKVNKRLRAEQLKILMAIIVLVVMVKMLLGFLLTPDILVSYAGGH
ncbi:MAG: permease [Armatimonadetes bacterium CG_4_10_14_3_um_filter_66_18]|nr:sulfite exporter TauE/SafE family protein [Armatimonadota bacterium]NDK13377.1 sulfite exporter TauE/SafE family protein [Armatimonadota bacterium]OIO91435.1 MAG: permease [Armatimonadetes bacterium CG2_30_66_41]PIU94238.1 MAG: permease [Armatimonadetes bacterium CG06_land_8_20_14_3_00_66_21]PIY49221.1 MAG: permease [Armatimonadetes bacterium CG_4_10_14_3_um_filter_66_18]